MRKILAFFAGLLLAAGAGATILTGQIKDSQGRNVNGTLTLMPSVRGNVAAGACGGPYILSPNPPFNIPIVNGSPPAGVAVPGNDCILPAFSYYAARLVASNGNVLFAEYWRVTGLSVNIGQILPIVSPVAPDAPVNGDVTGSLSQTVVSRLAGVPLSLTPPVTGQILKFDGVSWVSGSVSGTGTVVSVALTAPAQFSVAGSPVTSGGTLGLSWANVAQNKVLSGPTSGADAAPAFRLLTAADIPVIPESGVTNLTTDLAARALSATTVTATSPLTGSGTLGAPLTLGISPCSSGAAGSVPATGGGTTNFLRADCTFAPAGSGSVTSVGLTAPGIFTVSGSPVTGASSLTLGLSSEPQNAVWAGPGSGGGGPPAFRALVAADIPAIAEAQVTGLTADLAAKANASLSVTTIAPLTGTGTLASNLTLGINNFTSSTAGAAPASGGGTANFLRADATFQPVVTSVGVTAPTEFAVSGSPLTTTGTIAITKQTQSANLIYAGPAAGAATQPTFRSMAVADLPAIPESSVTNLVTDLAGKVPTSRLVSTTGSLAGGGNLASDRSLSLSLNSSGCLSESGGLGVIPGCVTGTLTGYVKTDGTTPLTGNWDAGNFNIGINTSPSYGVHVFGGGERLQALATPGAPSVANLGATGATTYTYLIVAVDRNGGKTLVGPAGTTTTGNAALSGSNFNRLTWGAVTGAASYDVLKNGTSASLTTSLVALTLDDTGQSTSVYTPPVRNTTADLTVDGNLSVGGASFSSLSVPGSITANNFISTVSTGAAPLTVASTTAVTNLTLAADSQLPTISTGGKVLNSATTATSANTAFAIVARDASGNFSAGTITGTLVGTATGITGTLPINQGGTGQTTAAAGFNALSPLTTTGDTLYESGASTAARLAGNATTAKQFLSSTGTGAAAQAPAWTALAGSDIPSINESQVTNLTTDLAGKVSTTTQVIAGSGLSGGGALSSNVTLSIPAGGVTDAMLASTPTAVNTPSTIVKRDGSGNFAAGTITANLTGNASGSAASFTGSLSGDVTGTQAATVVSSVGGSTAANVHSAELAANAATSANTASTIVKRDGSGGFSAGNVTATLHTGPVTALKSATTSVDVSAATAPAAGSILTATNATAATWVATAGGGPAVGSSRQITTAAPLNGGGPLTGDLALNISPCGPSGGGHSAGYVPDPGSSAGTTKFLREDCTWSAAGGGAVSSVGLSAPAIFSISGSPVTSTGTLGFDFQNQAANTVIAGPVSGGAAYPGFRLLVAGDIPNIAESQVVNLVTDLGNLVPATRQVIAGTGMTGGGSLGSDVTLGLSTPIAVVNGGTGSDLSTTGGASQYVKQVSVGQGFTVGTIPLTDVSPLTTKGDVYVFGAANTRLPVGSDGQVLTADSTQATGLKYVTVTGTGTVTTSGLPTSGQIAQFTGSTVIAGINVVPLASGGTGQTTAMGARGFGGLNVEGVTAVGNADYGILATDRTVATNATFTASRAWTLPAANAVNAGGAIYVSDMQGTVTPTNTLVITRAGSDLINGATSFTMTAAYDSVLLISDGSSKWITKPVAAGAGTVTSVATTAPVTGGTITSSGTIGLSVTAASDGGAVAKQASTPGTQQTGNVNVSGVGKFDGGVTSLKSATTVVDIAGAPAPSAGQVLQATSATDAAWQTLSAPGAVALQGSTPGTPDTGNFNVSGTGIAGLFSGPVTALKSATTSVDVASATAPSNGQVLTATSGTAATWQTPAAGTVTSIATTSPITGGTITSTGTLGISITTTNDGGAVAKQASSPGTQQTGNANLSGTVIATTFSGALSGNATTATTATNATNTAVTDDTTTNATMYPTWVTTTTGNLPQKLSSTKLTFNPSTGTLSPGATLTGGVVPVAVSLAHVATNTTAVGVTTFEQASADADSFDLVFKKARGTVASPTVVTTADQIGTIQFAGYGGASGYIVGAAIKAYAVDTIADTRIPGVMTFLTGTNATPSVLTEWMRIDDLGRVGIGTNGPSALLHLGGQLANNGELRQEQASADADSFDATFYKARGAFGSLAAVTAADELGTIQFFGYSGAGGYVASSAIKVISTATVATTRVPSDLSFWTGTDAVPTVVTKRMTIDHLGNIVTNTAALATNATDGFLYVPTSAGAPSGTPTTQTGTAPIEYDTTNNFFYVYNGGWKKTNGATTQSSLLTAGTSFSVPVGVTLVYVTIQGGGAAGGGGAVAEAGGGSGELIYRRPWVVTSSGTVAYTIGAGGTGGAGNGPNGTASTWDTSALSAAGGIGNTSTTSGGGGGRLGGAAVSGAVGIAGTFDVDVRGGSSGGGVAFAGGGTDQNAGGTGPGGGGGAASHFGAGGNGGSASAGVAACATCYGAAGGGTSTGTHNGGSGTQGVILVEWVAP